MTDHITKIREALEAGPVSGLCRFDSEQSWQHCSAEHHLMVQSKPNGWQGYETRGLYGFDPESIRSLLAALDEARQDARRLDWLETQRMAYGFQGIHEGNEWKVDGPFATARAAIDAAIAAQEGGRENG